MPKAPGADNGSKDPAGFRGASKALPQCSNVSQTLFVNENIRSKACFKDPALARLQDLGTGRPAYTRNRRVPCKPLAETLP